MKQKRKRINMHKRNNTKTHITKTPTHYKTHTYAQTVCASTEQLLAKIFCDTYVYWTVHYRDS